MGYVCDVGAVCENSSTLCFVVLRMHIVAIAISHGQTNSTVARDLVQT